MDKDLAAARRPAAARLAALLKEADDLSDEFDRRTKLVRAACEIPLDGIGTTILSFFKGKSEDRHASAFVGDLEEILAADPEAMGVVPFLRHVALVQATAEAVGGLYGPYGEPPSFDWRGIRLDGRGLPPLDYQHPLIRILRDFSDFDDSE